MEGNSGSCLCYVVDICLHFFFVEAAISVEPSQKVSSRYLYTTASSLVTVI